MELQKTVGNTIRNLRAKQGFSQESFADACGIHRSHMGQIERGQSNITLQTLERLSKALGVPIVQFFKDVR